MAGPITIKVNADASQARREFGSAASAAEQSGGKIKSGLGNAGKVAIAGLAVAGVAACKMGSAVVDSASKAQQSLGATETVFGKYADTVIKRSNEAAQSIGVSANEYRELSNVVGASLKGAGIPIEQ